MKIVAAESDRIVFDVGNTRFSIRPGNHLHESCVIQAHPFFRIQLLPLDGGSVEIAQARSHEPLRQAIENLLTIPMSDEQASTRTCREWQEFRDKARALLEQSA